MSDGSFHDTRAHFTHDRTDTSTATPNAPRVPPTASFVDHTYPTTSCADQSHSSTVLTSPAPPVGSVLVGLVARPPRSAVFRTVDSCERPPSTSELGAGPRQACGGDTRPLPHLLQPSGASSVANPSPRPHAAAALKGAASGQSSRKQVGWTTGGPHMTYSATWCLSCIHLKSRWVDL